MTPVGTSNIDQERANSFLWGTALSAHPVEGGNFDTDWWRWEQRPGRIRDGATSKAASGHFDRFAADFDLARKLGHRAVLFNIEWARVQPARNTFDDAAVDHYAAVLDSLIAKGIEPVCVLHHVSNPFWFTKRGGWAQTSAPKLFARYVDFVLERCGSKCRWWIPVHESMHGISMAYFERVWPPGSANMNRAMRALKNMARGHAHAYKRIHETRPDARVGAGVRGRVFRPLDANSVWDLRVARREAYRCNHLYLEALDRGKWPLSLFAESGLAGTFDFVGLSYYGSETVRFKATRLSRLFCQPVDPRGEPLAFSRAGADAEGLRGLLHEMTRYPKPVLVVGNGVATEDDSERGRYLIDHVSVVLQCIEEGLDVRGYFYYSLLDGFEWTDGYAAHYGLVHVDRETLARTPNPSAYLYKDICENNAVRPGAVAQFCPTKTAISPEAR